MNHLNPDQLSALVDGALSGEALKDARAHLGECNDCRTALAKLQAQDDALFAAKAELPGDDYFDSFAARVQERLSALDTSVATAEPVDDRPALEGTPPPRSAGTPRLSALFGWFQSPGRVAWAGGVAVVVVGAGLALMTMRETAVPLLRDSEVEEAMDQSFRDEAKQSAPEAQQVEGSSRAQKLQEADDGAAGARQDVAPPSRAREMRRTESGEDVPVDRDVPRFAQKPVEEAAPQTTPGEPAYVRKPRVASPLTGRSVAEAEAPATSLDSRDAVKKETAKNLSLQSKVEGTQLCGQVHDAANRPLVGAQVVLTDQGVTTTTDADGRFCVESPPGTQTLSIMAVGFETVRQSIDVGVSSEPLAVKLDAVDVLGKSKQAGSASALSPSALAPGGAKRAFDEDAPSIPKDAVVATREAQRLTTLAQQDESASRWDQAADAWANAAGLMPAGGDRIDAMYQTAEARKKAWDQDPSDKRKANARKAFEEYLKTAPAGPSRERIEAWQASLGS